MHETESPVAETADERAERERHEAEAMRRFPGVEFWWSNGERRAKLKGSGIEVWELIRALESVGWVVNVTAEMWPHVERAAIVDALGYYRVWPGAVNDLIARNDAYERAHFAALAEERSATALDQVLS